MYLVFLIIYCESCPMYDTISLTEDGKIRQGDKVGAYTIYDTSKIMFDIEPPEDYEFVVKDNILFFTDLDTMKTTGYFKDDHPCFLKVQEKQNLKKEIGNSGLTGIANIVKNVKEENADGKCTKEEFFQYWEENSSVTYSQSQSGQAAKRNEMERLSQKYDEYDEYMEISEEIDKLNEEINNALQ